MKRNILSKILVIFFAAGLLLTAYAQPPVPTLYSPSDASTGQSLQPTFVWNHTSTAVQWQLQIATDAAFSSLVFSSGIISDTTYTYTTPLNPGTTYYWHVRASDGFTASSYSSTSTFTTNYLPVASSVTVTGTLNVGATLNGSYSYSDTDGDLEGTSTFQWYRSDDNAGTGKVAIGGATNANYTLDAADLGKYITFEVTPVAATGASPGTAVESSYYGPVAPNQAPVATSVSVGGVPSVGTASTGNYTYTDTEGDPEGTSTFKWYIANDGSGTGETLIVGATSNSYTPVAGDLGKYIAFEVTPVASSGTTPGTPVKSSYAGPVVTNAAPVASSVNISGSGSVGSLLTGSYTYSDNEGDPEGTSTFQWYRSDNASGLNKIAIGGATNLTYTLVAADVSKYITFAVTPVATTGTSPGSPSESAYLGPISSTPPPATPVIYYPADSTYRTTDTLTLKWLAVSGATSYRIQVTADPTFSWITIVDSVGCTDTTLTISNPLGHGAPYYWRVRAVNGTLTGAWTNRYMFTVSINGVEGPQIPVPSWPIGNNDVFSDSVDVSWKLDYSDSSLVFDIKLGLDSTFATTLVDSVGATGQSILVRGLSSDSTYYWKIRSRDKIHPDTSDYSPVAVFHVSKFSTHPLLAWPIGGGNVFQASQTFSWYVNGPAPGITFDLTLSRNSDLSTPDTVATGLTSRFITLYNLRSNTTYYWQVVSHIPGFSDSSAIESFFVVEAAGPVVPVLTWPIGGNDVYTNVPTLNWYVNSTGSGLTYDVRFGLDATALSSATVNTTVNNYFDVPTPLLSDTTYYWQVRSKNGTDSSSYSAVDSFRVAAGSGNPVVPIPSWPIKGGEVHTNNPTFNWYLNTPSTGLTYEVRYSQVLANLSSATIHYAGSSWSFTVPIDTPLSLDTTYYWQVRSRSLTDSSAFCAADSFKIVSGSGNPVVPIPSWPIGGATVNPNPPILNWYLNVPASGLKFQVQYSVNSDFSGASTAANIDTNNYQIPTTLSTGITYYWRVRSYNSLTSDSSAWSVTETFVTSDALVGPVPVLGSPVWNLQEQPLILKTTSPTLSWYLPTAPKEAVSYELLYSNSPDFSGAVTVNNINGTATQISGIDLTKTYYWKVRSITSNGNSSFSRTGIFGPNTVTGINDVASLPNKFELYQNYPNPFNPSTIIKYSIPKSEFVVIKVYNILGQEVKTLVNTQLSPGNYTVQWNGDNSYGAKVSSGAYIYRVIAGDFIQTKKMILLK